MNNLYLPTSISPPCPIASNPSKIKAVVPDISFLQGSHTALSMNFKDTADTCESDKKYAHPYEQDLRLKFYQILQSNSRRDLSKVPGAATERPYSSAQHFTATIACEKNLSPATFEKNSSIHHNDLIKQRHHSQGSHKANIPSNNPPSTKPAPNFDCIPNHRYNKNSIGKLFALVESQSEQLELLKLQINILLSKLGGCQDNIAESSQVVDIGIKPFDSIKCHKQNHSEEMRAISAVNKVSIGVMTSFEFSIRNNLNVNAVTAENPVSPVEIHGGGQSHDETTNLLKSPLEKIIERSEGRFSEQSDRHEIESNQEVQNRCINKLDYPVDKSVNASTKVGWTFYNNILCHVNEILHDSNTVHPSQIPYNVIQNSNRQQLKLLETAFPEAANSITSDISDKVFALDSFAYPRVHCQTSIVQTSDSTADTNASVHMKKLAVKYLGENYCELDSVSQFKKSMNDLGTTHTRLDLIMKNTMSLSTRSYMNHESLIATNPPKFVKPNILDISILKRQPKLL